MNSPLRFAIIGCGKIAPRHAKEAARQGRLVAVCDIDREKADQLAESFRTRAYYDIRDLLENEKEIDVVAVCTPNGYHALHAILALEAGCHVLCEKPMSITVSDGEKMMDAAARCGKKLFVVKSTRYNPALASLKKLLDSGRLGPVYSFQLNCFWNRPPAYYEGTWRGTSLDGGTLFTQFSHYVDALLWLLGDIKNVSGLRKNRAHRGLIESEDSGIAALEMENEVTGGLNWSVNAFGKNMEVSLTILAEKGSLRIGGEYMNKIEYQLTDGADLKVVDEGHANDYGFYKGSMSNHDQVYENMIRALRDENHPITQAADGLKTVAAIEKIYQSISLS